MSDSARSETNVNGNVTGPVQSGAFDAPVQTTMVQLIQRAMQEELPEILQNATLHHILMANIKAQQSLEERIYQMGKSDGVERIERQKETDHYRSLITGHLRDIGARVARVEVAFIGLVVGLALAGMLVFLVAMK